MATFPLLSSVAGSRRFLNRATSSACTSFLVNTSRGAVIEVDDLLHALDSGILAGAALDVLPVEPVPADSRLLQQPQLILTPHAAFFSVQAEIELRRKAAQNIVSWVKRGRPDYVVVAGTRRPA